MFVNNEMGAIEPISVIGGMVREFRESLSKSRNLKISKYPLFHVDATQAFQFFECNVNQLGVDFMTLSSHKIYGPKGAAALYVRDRNENLLLAPLATGGGQEFGLRSGTENVPAIVGFTKAIERALPLRTNEMSHAAVLHERLWAGIKKMFPAAESNDDNGLPNNKSPLGCRSNLVSPHVLNIYFPGHDAQDILTRLDRAGVAASSGSACRSRALESSYVIEALGYSKERAKSSIRFSFGRPTTEKEIDATLKVLKEILK
jgi:cysteine desulfurase